MFSAKNSTFSDKKPILPPSSKKNLIKSLWSLNHYWLVLFWQAITRFSSPPESTVPEAIDHFLTAENLKPEGWKENRLFIAKCYIAMGDYAQAVTWLDKADSIPLASPDVREGMKVSSTSVSRNLVNLTNQTKTSTGWIELVCTHI